MSQHFSIPCSFPATVLQAGADPNIETKEGLSPAALAVAAFYLRTVESLLPRSSPEVVQDALRRAVLAAAQRDNTRPASGVLRSPVLRCILRSPVVDASIIVGAITSMSAQLAVDQSRVTSLLSDAVAADAAVSRLGRAALADTQTPATAALVADADRKRAYASAAAQGAEDAVRPRPCHVLVTPSRSHCRRQKPRTGHRHPPPCKR